MTNLMQAILFNLAKAESRQSQKECLEGLCPVFYDCLQPDNVVCFELIPETGGTLNGPPYCHGRISQSGDANRILQGSSIQGMLGDFIRHWQVVVEKEAHSWASLSLSSSHQSVDFSRFLEAEGIQAFIFLPVFYDDERLGMYFLNYREQLPPDLPDSQLLEACSLLIGAHLHRFFRGAEQSYRQQKQMAMAHTLYGQAAIHFIGQVDLLQARLQEVFGGEAPTAVTEQLTTVKNSIFSVMRDLVINAAGDMLVDLKSMSLGEALHATASALERAWPADTMVHIDIPRIPPLIERQPLALKEILYTLILELVGNAVIHGGPAPYVSVDIIYHNYTIYLQVLDHGRGFNIQEHTYSPHGLGFWQSYIEKYLNGYFHLASQPDFGTAVQVQIPIVA